MRKIGNEEEGLEIIGESLRELGLERVGIERENLDSFVFRKII